LSVRYTPGGLTLVFIRGTLVGFALVYLIQTGGRISSQAIVIPQKLTMTSVRSPFSICSLTLLRLTSDIAAAQVPAHQQLSPFSQPHPKAAKASANPAPRSYPNLNGTYLLPRYLVRTLVLPRAAVQINNLTRKGSGSRFVPHV